MNYPKDGTLAALGKQMSAAEFITQLSPAAQQRLEVVDAADAAHKIRGVRRAPGLKNACTYIVQSYVGGEVRTFCCVNRDHYKAARIADMLTAKFGHLRLRFLRPTTDADYNFTKEQAELDLQNEPAIAGAVEEIFQHLRKLGAILNPAAPVSVPRSAKPIPPSLESRLDAIEKTLNSILQRLPVK